MYGRIKGKTVKEETIMSEIIEKYEQYYKKCTRMFTKAICRIIDDKRIKWDQKIKYMRDIDRWIDIASERCDT